MTITSHTTDDRCVRVFLCDDVADLRRLLRLTLDGEPDLRVVGEADDGLTGLLGINHTKPDVVVLDLNMPEMDGLETLEGIKIVAPDTRVVVFTGFPDDANREYALRNGAQRFLAKGVPLAELVAAIRDVAGVAANGEPVGSLA